MLREPLSLCLTLNTPLMERGRQGRRERGGGKILSVHTLRGACGTASCHRGVRSLFLVIALDVGSHLVGGVCRTPLGLGAPPPPPDSRPRQPRPALPLPGAEHSCTSSLGPAAHSVPGRAQAELREMSLRTDFPESAKQIAAGNHQQKNTSNGRGAEAAAPAGRAHWTRHVGSYKKRWRRNVCEQHLETSQRAGSFVCTERNHHRQVWGRERICGVSIKIGAQRKSCQALPCLAAPENPSPCTQRCPRSRQHPGTAWPRLPRPLRVT